MYKGGWSKAIIQVQPKGLAMHGYGQPGHRAWGSETALYARTLVLVDDQDQRLIWCCLDTGYVTHAMRSACIEALGGLYGGQFNSNTFVLTCTHTHSGPGGCSQDILYNLVTPGFQPLHLKAVVDAALESIQTAWEDCKPCIVQLGTKTFCDHTPVAWNRALSAWNRNPDVEQFKENECHKALDREMQVLSFQREDGETALLSLFGVHATCLGNTTDRYNGDNKGYAASHAESMLGRQSVAIFSQSAAGDVSPHFHGPGQLAARQSLLGQAELDYAKRNGELQSMMALSILHGREQLQVQGSIQGVLSHVDFTNLKANPRFAGGNAEAWTSDACHGIPFFKGTPVDGHGLSDAVAKPLSMAARQLRYWRLSRVSGLSEADKTYYKRLYAAQGNKDILIECERKLALNRPLANLGLPDFVDPLVAELNRQGRQGNLEKGAMIPTLLPLQIVTLGTLAIVCCPGEFTTTAGRRLREQLQQTLSKRGITHTLICTYCNDYMGYVTTQEEYQAQTYEGGHTVFGQWTLAAFQTEFDRLSEGLLHD